MVNRNLVRKLKEELTPVEYHSFLDLKYYRNIIVMMIIDSYIYEIKKSFSFIIILQFDFVGRLNDFQKNYELNEQVTNDTFLIKKKKGKIISDFSTLANGTRFQMVLYVNSNIFNFYILQKAITSEWFDILIQRWKKNWDFIFICCVSTHIKTSEIDQETIFHDKGNQTHVLLI